MRFWKSWSRSMLQHIRNVSSLLISAKSRQISPPPSSSSQNSKVHSAHVSNLTIDEDSNLVRSAIEHICFLADVNRLYDEALGLYRLDIALLIAQKSQKVPELKEESNVRILENIYLFCGA